MKEMYEVLEKEPWFYHTDVISMRKVHEPAQLKPDFVNHVSLWTQFHNVPPEMLSAKGIIYLAEQIGTPISEGLKDSLPLDHPTLGPITIHLVYKRAARLCNFCGCVGHVISGCATRSRVLQLCTGPRYSNNPELQLLRNHRKGVWINCMALVPRELPVETQPEFSFPPISPPTSAHQNSNPLSPLDVSDLLTQVNPTQQGTNLEAAYHPALPAGPHTSGQRHLSFNTDALSSLPDQASPLYCKVTAQAETTNLSNQTRHLTIHDHS